MLHVTPIPLESSRSGCGLPAAKSTRRERMSEIVLSALTVVLMAFLLLCLEHAIRYTGPLLPP